MKKILLLVFLCLSIQFAWAQMHSVSGTVTDNKTLAPIQGVNILEKGSQNGTTTNLNGQFTLNVKSDSATLVFSFIGFQDQVIKLAGQNQLNIKLTAQSTELNEIVVTALNLKRESKDLGYAVQKLESKELAEVKSPNFVDNLAGRVAGVTVSQGATGVGSSSKITIRGEASFTNNNPLFVVDGTPINNYSVVNNTNDAAIGFQEVDFGNGAMDVNPDDIESVTVLKGPSAAALYGTRASNGVIIITTKDGSTSKGIGVSYNSTTYFEQAFKLPEFQNKYGQGNSGNFEYVDGLGGGTNDNISYSWGPELNQGTLIAQYNSPVQMADGSTVRGGDIAVHGGRPITPTEFKAYPDNLKNFYQTGRTTINNIAVNSGFEKGSYRLSFTDMRSESIIPGVNLDRTTIAGRMNFDPTEKLHVSTSLNYMSSNSDNRPANGYGSENVNYSIVAWGPRSLDIEPMRNFWQPGLQDLEQYSFNYTYFDNPYFTLYENRNSFNRDRAFGNIMATYDISEHITFSVRSGMDYSDELREFRRAYSSNRFQNGAYAEHTVTYKEINTDFLLNYNNRFGAFSTDFSFGGNRMDRATSSVQTQALSLAQPGVYNLSNAASPLEVSEYETQKRINSLYGLFKLGYRNFLYLDITGRNDWSSALATPINTENTSFFYPSAALSYLVSNTVNLPKVISFFKLRGNWAQVGNDPDPYQTTGAFISQTPVGGLPTFSAQNIITNNNLLPEKTTSIEFGGDIRFYNDRIRLDVTYYNALTENQIISLPVAASSGYTQQVVNGGKVRSKGWEIMLGIQTVKKEKFQWNTFFNFSRNVSTVESLPGGVDKLTLAYSRVYDNVNQTIWFQVEEGGRIGDMYGTGYKKNENGEFVLTATGNYIGDNELIKLGNYNPDFILGISNNLKYGNWDLSFLFDWRQGGVLVSRTLSLGAVGGQLIETEDRPVAGIVAEGVVNTGTEENPVYVENTTAIPAETYYRSYYDRNHEENNTYNASYLKLRQFSIGYSFSCKNEKGILNSKNSIRIAIVGRNLFAISQIPHFDPEQLAVQGQQFVNGVEDMSYATTRSIGLKLNLNF